MTKTNTEFVDNNNMLFEKLGNTLGENEKEEIRNRIFEENKGLLHSLAKKSLKYYQFLGVHAYSEDDFVQEGSIYLFKAIDTFDYKKGYKFSTYAMPIISRGMNHIDNARMIKKHANKGFVSMNAPLNDDPESTFGDFLADENAVSASVKLSEKELHLVLTSAFSVLTAKELSMIRQAFGIGCDRIKIVHIAKKCGFTPQRANQIIKKALKKLSDVPAVRELAG